MKPGPTRMGIGLKRQATSFGDSPKNLRSSLDPDTKVQIIQGVRHNVARRYVAASNKRQATSPRIPDYGYKRQAPSSDKNF